jgi:hypothetical protein
MVYHALIAVDDSDGLHERVSLEAESLAQAKHTLAAQHGDRNIVSVWGEWESQQSRGRSG